MSYTSTRHCRNLMDSVILAVDVQEGNLFIGCGPAAWAVPSLAHVLSNQQTLTLQLCQCQVVVAAIGHTFATAVPENNDFIADIAQTELAYCHFLVCQ